MKRRQFIKVSAFSAAALSILGPAVAKEKTIEGLWVNEDLFVRPTLEYHDTYCIPRMNKFAPKPHDIVRFYNGVMGFVPGKGMYNDKTKKISMLVIPIKKDVCLAECENMVCMVLNSARPEDEQK